MKKRALLIGLNEYHTLGSLHYARQDAESVANALRSFCGFTDDEISLMTCSSKGAQQGLSKHIERALDRLADCRELDLLIFGFWGHGFAPSGRRYLCGVDTYEDDLDRTSVSLVVVSGKLAQVQSENTLLFLDCCQNRPAGRAAVTEPMSKGEEASFSEMARDIQAVRQSQFRSSTPTVAIWNACRDGQKAYEWVDKGHGIFTAYLLEAFEKGHRNVAAMASWTSDKVAKKAGDLFGQRQNPFIKIEGRGDIELVELVPSGSIRPPVEPTQSWIKPPRPSSEQFREKPKLVEAYYPMTAEQAAEVQRAASEALGVMLATEEELGRGVKMKMILIPPGKFIMGSPKDEPDRVSHEGPRHEVIISRPFYLGVYEVTQRQWEAVMGNNPSLFKKGGDFPVENVSWDDVQCFIYKLSAKKGKDYRLPTEAEWEYACRAGTNEARYGDLDKIAWYIVNSGEETHPAGKMLPNSFGLYDMLGNVFEWCQDWYGKYKSKPDIDPKGPLSGQERIIRGGSWFNYSSSARASSRGFHEPFSVAGSMFGTQVSFPDLSGPFQGYGTFSFRLAKDL